MSVRPLDFLDLPFLNRYRQDVLALDQGRLVTRGSPLGARALLSYLNPNRQIYTALSSTEGEGLMGQVILKGDESFARLSFLAPAGHINGSSAALLEALAAQAGEWGAQNVVAEIDEEHPAFRALRQAGFAMYAWQRLWRLPRAAETADCPWRAVEEGDLPGMQSLHTQIVPALLQPVEALARTGALVCREAGRTQGFLTLERGARGVWVKPLIPPDAPLTPELLASLAGLPGLNPELPVVVCVRSYQAWLEAPLHELGAEASPRQALMVKRMALPVQEMQPVTTLEKSLAKIKPAAPVSHIQNREN